MDQLSEIDVTSNKVKTAGILHCRSVFTFQETFNLVPLSLFAIKTSSIGGARNLFPKGTDNGLTLIAPLHGVRGLLFHQAPQDFTLNKKFCQKSPEIFSQFTYCFMGLRGRPLIFKNPSENLEQILKIQQKKNNGYSMCKFSAFEFFQIFPFFTCSLSTTCGVLRVHFLTIPISSSSYKILVKWPFLKFMILKFLFLFFLQLRKYPRFCVKYFASATPWAVVYTEFRGQGVPGAMEKSKFSRFFKLENFQKMLKNQ